MALPPQRAQHSPARGRCSASDQVDLVWPGRWRPHRLARRHLRRPMPKQGLRVCSEMPSERAKRRYVGEGSLDCDSLEMGAD
jgi:hypothetical protein